jgi:hypothetical protein
VLRQLGRLTRALPAAGPEALAIAVYADADDAPVVARESGWEGVACIDDAARALDMLCMVWQATELASVRRWCDGLLDFVVWMQDPDGRWVNFVSDWDGTVNRSGASSFAGGDFWQARALQAMTRAAIVLGDARAEASLERGLGAVNSPAPADVRALHVLTALELLHSGRAPWLREHLPGWIDELLACSRDGMLLNWQGESGHPHLWGHVQEAALAGAGALLTRDDAIAAAERSAELVFGEAIESGFDLPHVQPYDVASAIQVMDGLHAVTGAPRYAELAVKARQWFDGRNPAGLPVYDTVAGRVADGIDEGRVSRNSGAESNVVAAQALPQRALAAAGHCRAAQVHT